MPHRPGAQYRRHRRRHRPWSSPIPSPSPAPPGPGPSQRQRLSDQVRLAQGLAPDALLAVGVERFDYTKGIADRFRAIETLLEQHPEWLGRLTLLQIAAPSRSQLPSYRLTQEEAEALASAVNQRFGRPGWQPIRAGATPSRAGRGVSPFPRRRPLPGVQPARWHEPGGQGVCRRPGRRGRGTGIERLRRRIPRTAGGPHRQSLRQPGHGQAIIAVC